MTNLLKHKHIFRERVLLTDKKRDLTHFTIVFIPHPADLICIGKRLYRSRVRNN